MERFDVAVVGGGIAGVSIAYELAADRSVVLLEAEDRLAAHTTGRSAALYLPSYGPPPVRALTRASRPDFDRLVDDLDTPPLLTPRTLVVVATDDSPQARAGLDAWDADPVDPADAAGLCPLLRGDRVVAAVTAEVSDIDVMALHAGYVRGLRRRGGEVRTGAPVTALERPDGGDGWHVTAGGDQLEVGTLVDAAGAWGDELAGLAGVAPVGLRPLRRTLAVVPLEGHDTTGWATVTDARDRFYLKPEPGAVLVSPADETPDEPRDATVDPADVARALEAASEVTIEPLRHVRTAWAGLRTFAPSGAPVVGPDRVRDDFLWFVGQGGYGIQLAPALARLGAALLRDEPVPADLAGEGVDPVALAPPAH